MSFICLLPTTHPCPTQAAVPSVALVTNWPIWTMMETLFFFFFFYLLLPISKKEPLLLHFILFFQAHALGIGGGYQL